MNELITTLLSCRPNTLIYLVVGMDVVIAIVIMCEFHASYSITWACTVFLKQ